MSKDLLQNNQSGLATTESNTAITHSISRLRSSDLDSLRRENPERPDASSTLSSEPTQSASKSPTIENASQEKLTRAERRQYIIDVLGVTPELAGEKVYQAACYVNSLRAIGWSERRAIQKTLQHFNVTDDYETSRLFLSDVQSARQILASGKIDQLENQKIANALHDEKHVGALHVHALASRIAYEISVEANPSASKDQVQIYASRILSLARRSAVGDPNVPQKAEGINMDEVAEIALVISSRRVPAKYEHLMRRSA